MQAIARVIVELSLDREFDYLIPDEIRHEVRIGSRVIVPFGHSEARGYVVGFSDKSNFKTLKHIKSVVGKKPLIDDEILKLARWMGDYYLAPVEAAVRTVLPSAVRGKDAGFKQRLCVTPTPMAEDEEAISEVRKKAPKQAEVLDVLLTDGQVFLNHLAKAAHTTAGTIRALEKKGFVHVGRQTVGRDPKVNQAVLRTQPLELMPEQSSALETIKVSIDTRIPPVVLLHGVTGSGKTEVYLQALQYAMDRDMGAIIMVPEISLTPQTVERFQGRFGDCVAVLHSHLSDGERHDEWHRIHDGAASIAIGARSALFAPVRNLGLIVVDEEHEPTYKQEETPRYNARDVAVMRGRMHNCAVVLGSATPSLESYANAKAGKYALAVMPHRVDHRRMPAIRVVDMRQEAEKQGGLHVFSQDLLEAMQKRLDAAEQIMLFLNRRGFSTSLVCKKCGYVAMCRDCSVSMTYHKSHGLLRCHICDAAHKVPGKCPECGDPSFRYTGIGTERVSEVITKVFPKARVSRMDSDTMTRKESYHQVLGDFRTGKIDILVGTQMIAKGLHFPNVTLVGVINADTMLHMPDFRGGERTLQLLTQVAGRAGRGEVSGEVIVQTFTPFHPAVQFARRLDFDGFVDQEIEFRRELGYPPFSHLTCITMRGPSEDQLKFATEKFAKELKTALPDTVIVAGPTPAPIARAKGMYRYQIMLRYRSSKSMKGPLKSVLSEFRWPGKISCQVDVDALSIL